MECFIGHIKIQLGNHLKGCMHRENRNTNVNHIDIQIRDIHSYGSAAAAIDLAKLTGLPQYVVLLQKSAYLSHKFSGGFAGSALAAGSGILGQDRKSVV